MRKIIGQTILVMAIFVLSSCNGVQEGMVLPTKTNSPTAIPSLTVTARPLPTQPPTQTFVPTAIQTQAPTPYLQVVKRSEFQVGGIAAVTWSYDSTKFALCGSVDDHNGLFIYDAETFQDQLFIPEIGCLDIAYSSDGNTIAATTGDQFASIKVWDAVTGNLITQYGGNANFNISFTTDPNVVNTCRSVGARSGPYTTVVRSFMISTKETETIFEHDGWLMSCSISENDELLSVGLHRIQTGDKWDQVVLWNIVSDEVACNLDGVEAVLSQSGKLVGTNDYDGNIVIWDTETCQPQLKLLGGPNLPAMAISSDDKLFVYEGKTSVYLLEIENSDVPINMKDITCEGGFMGNLSFSPDNESLIATCLYNESESQSAKLLVFDILR
jgi:hypothetical protein